MITDTEITTLLLELQVWPRLGQRFQIIVDKLPLIVERLRVAEEDRDDAKMLLKKARHGV